MATSPLQAVPTPDLSDLVGDWPADSLAQMTYAEKRLVMTFATAAARDAAITAPVEGMVAHLQDTDQHTYYINGAWRQGPWGVPWGTVGYAQVTADQTSITAVADLTSLTVTWTAVTGRRYRTTAKVEVTATAADGAFVLSITNSSNTAVQRATDGCLTTSTRTATAGVVETPSAGSTTRKLRLQKVGGSGSLTMSASATAPAFILVEDIGPA